MDREKEINMVTLRDILELTWAVTELTLDVREPELDRLIMSYKIGEGCNEDNATVHQKHRINKGELTMIDAKINWFGSKGSKGDGWGNIWKNIPKELLEMEVIHFTLSSRGSWEGKLLMAHLVPVQMGL